MSTYIVTYLHPSASQSTVMVPLIFYNIIYLILSTNHNIIIHDILRYKIFYNIHKLQFTFNWCVTTLNFPPKIIFINKVFLNRNNVVSRYKRKTALVTSCKRKSQSHKSMSSPLLKSTMAMEPA